MTERTVVLTGTFSSHNKGDATMQFVVATELKRALNAEDRVIIASPSAGRDRDFYGGIDVIFSRRRSVTFVFSLALAMVWGLVYTITRLRPNWLLFTDELRETQRADMVVDLSGDMLTEDYGFLIGFSHFVPLMQARFMRTPYVICAQSIGPFKRLRPLAKSMLTAAAAITIREDITRERVAGLDLDMETTADVSFILEPDHATADALLAAEGLTGKKFLGVSVSPILKKRYENANPGESFAVAIANALDTALAETDLHILFVPHVTGPATRHDDRIVAREVAEHLKSPHTLVEADLKPAALKGLISRTEAVLGARMHANMASLSQGVPLLALAYSHKTEGIMALFGQQDMIVDGKELTTDGLVLRIGQLLADGPARAKQIRTSLDPIHDLSRRNIERIVELVNARSAS